MSPGHCRFLVIVQITNMVSIVRICQSRNNPVGPVEGIRCYLSRRIGKVVWRCIHLGKERNGCIVRHGAIRNPLDACRFLWFIGTQLQNRCLAGPVDPDRPEGPLTHVISFRAIRIVDSVLVVVAQDIFDIFNRHLAIRFLTPRNLKTPWILLDFRIEETLDGPSPRCIVVTVLVFLATKGIAWIKTFPFLIQNQMVLCDKMFKIRVTKKLIGIAKFKIITSQLVRVGHIGIIRDTARHPVVTSDGFQPPDFIHI